jgi:SAM-dependent methyltransferase
LIAARLRNTWLHPRYIGSVHLNALIRNLSSHASGTLIDIGCGRRPYESMLRPHVTRYFGLDRPVDATHANMDVIADAMSLPLLDGCVDTVLATEVIEHLPDPDGFVAEVARVLRVSGAFIVSAPFMEPLHEEPRDYFRFTPHGLRVLLERRQFAVEIVEQRGGWWSVVVGSFVNQALFNWASPMSPFGRKRLWARALVLPWCSVAQLVGYGMDRVIRSRRYTLGYVVVARLSRKVPE